MQLKFTKTIALLALACMFGATAVAQESLDRLERLIDSPAAAGDESAALRGNLGVVVDDRASSADGVNVLVVRSATPAAAAGLLAGDRIVALDGTQTLDIDAFAAAAANLQAGRTVPVEVLRGSRRFEFQVTPSAGEATASTDAVTVARVPPEVTLPAPRVSGYANNRGRLGLVVGPLRTRSYPLLGVGSSWGVVVDDVIPGSPAQAYGVPRGANIIALNRIRVDRVSDLMLLMDQIDPSRPVELTYKYGGRAFHQAIPLVAADAGIADVGADEGVVEEELPPLPVPPLEPAKPPAAEPTPAGPKPPEAELRLSPPKEADVDAKRVEAMRSELEELRRRAAALEEALKDIRD